MNIPECIATLERIVRLERVVPATEKSAAEIARLYATLPPTDRESLAWLIRHVAEARVERADLQKQQAAAEAAIKAAQEAAKGGAWKFKGREQTETKEVTAARAAAAAAAAKLEELNKRIKPQVEMLQEEIQRQEELAELDAWRTGGYEGPVPQCILKVEEERRREFEKDCVTLKIPRTREDWAAWAAERDAREKARAAAAVTAEEEVETWDASDSMLSRILAGDFSAYYPKAVEAKVEAETPEVKVAHRRSGPKKTSSVEWMQRIIAAKKARGLAPAQVVPMGAS